MYSMLVWSESGEEVVLPKTSSVLLVVVAVSYSKEHAFKSKLFVYSRMAGARTVGGGTKKQS